MKSENELSEKEKRHRKALLFLPLLVLPFLTLLFWALGGGHKKEIGTAKVKQGMNTELPEPKTNSEPKNKLSYYELAAADSLRRLSQIKNDPYYNQPGAAGNGASSMQLPPDYRVGGPPGAYNGGSYPTSRYPDANEARIYDRLNALNSAMNQPAPSPSPATAMPLSNSTGVTSADIDRLEKMMLSMQSGAGGNQDPEVSQINSLMEKIRDIQHPQLVEERLREKSRANRGQIFPVKRSSDTDPVTVISSGKKSAKKEAVGFYSLDSEIESTDDEYNGINATVAENQTLVNGSIVKLRLNNEVAINGMLIPKDNLLFGVASIAGERLNVAISNIRYKNAIFPVKLGVFDMDGLEGVHIPGAIARDVAKDAGISAIQGIPLPAMDAGIGAQAAVAGIEMSRSFLSKKVKLIKVTVKAGYQIILKDLNEH